MGPSEDRPTTEKNQDGRLRTTRRRNPARRPRSRICLLKGCERRFRPRHPLTRYCSDGCRGQARRWREWKARHRYRQSEGGKQKRQAQSRRYRIRRKRAEKAKAASGKQREGHAKKKYYVPAATARAAMRSFSGAGVPPCSDFAAPGVGGPWRGFWTGNDAGENDSRNGGGDSRGDDSAAKIGLRSS